uniref:Glycosyltransferase n=1 Tax=Glycyrrhiza uralensis TaxID=74613 RepID=A0A6S4R2N7_GLYUR|nr:UDP-glycosyltransferase 88A19 [Glycyrrhiza uralensis]
MEQEALVFYPAPLISHLVSTIELCKLILTHQPSLSIHILTTKAPYDTTSTSNYITNISTTLSSSITFHNFPTPTLPQSTLLSSTLNQETLLFQFLHHNNTHLQKTLFSISKTHKIKALILDLFCSQSIPIIISDSQLNNIPCYIFFTSGASCLATLLYHPTLHSTHTKSFRELNNTLLNIPGVPPMPARDMPKPLLERNDGAYENCLRISGVAPKAAGFIVNTFEALEPRCIKAISDGLCLPNAPTPPLYCLGPIISNNTDQSQIKGGDRDHECLRWLDSQPSKSVVFLCFGSLGVFSREQLCETARGLERSGQRFLWVVRNPTHDHQKHGLALNTFQEDLDLDSLFPEGFLERTKERGLVVKRWAPQARVLSHDSVGGFVSHCGWNSVLEAVCAGVPMIGWPLYAEQRYNRVVLVEEIGIALWMHESNESGFVAASEVEERVRELMESEKGELVRKRVNVARDEARAALSEDGSSHLALAKLLKSL